MKYTKEILTEAVKKSISMAQVIRNLGLKEAGGTFMHIKGKIINFNIDTSHFLGQGHGIGKISRARKKWTDILIKRGYGKRCSAIYLRRSLIEIGREYKCEICNLNPLWNGKELRLQVDHKNQDWLDDSPENLRFVCPNCHSQTIGYNGSKNLTDVTNKTRGSRIYRKNNVEKIKAWKQRKRQRELTSKCFGCNATINLNNKTNF